MEGVKKKKKILLLLMLILVTGCSATYDLYIGNNLTDDISILEDKERFGIIEPVFPYFKTEEKEEKPKKYEKLIFSGAVIGFISITALIWACIRILWKLV